MGQSEGSVTFQPLDQYGVRHLVEMAADEGWNPGLHDAETFFQADPEGFLGLYQGDEFSGGGAIVRHSARFGFMGLFIVPPPLRGGGLGRKLWFERRNRLLDRLQPNATIGLDGVSAMIPFYAKGGFVPQYRTVRYEVSSPTDVYRPDPRVRPLGEVGMEYIEALDRMAFPSARSSYLNAWLAQPESIAVFHEGFAPAVHGFGVLRPCRQGAKVGPLFADSPEIAERILHRLLADFSGGPVYLDMPETNRLGTQWARGRAFREVFSCTRMYLGPVPKYNPALIYGLTSFELG